MPQIQGTQISENQIIEDQIDDDTTNSFINDNQTTHETGGYNVHN